MFSVPITLPEVYGGFAEAHGIARFDGAEFSLEFAIQDGLFGVVKSGVKEITLSAAEIAAVAFKRKAFYVIIAIRCHRVKSVERLPNRKGGEFKIKIKRAYRDDAEALVSALQLAVAEARLEEIQKRIE